MRVSLPVEPFFKTESEAATLSYIRTHTSIPVPEVIEWDSSADNPLGFEWVLVDKVEGVCMGEQEVRGQGWSDGADGAVVETVA